jgi:hypothetical protein
MNIYEYETDIYEYFFSMSLIYKLQYTYMSLLLITYSVLIVLGLIVLYYKFKRPIGPETKTVEGFKQLLKLFDGFKKVGKTIAGFFSRFKNIGKAFQYGGQGTGQAIATSGVITGLMFKAIFEYAYEAATYGYRWLTCSIEKLKNIHYCFIFYILDIILYLMYIIILSTIVLLDAIFQVKSWLGYSLQSGFNRSVKSIRDLDKVIYSYSGIHIIKYPTYIETLCYKCKVPPDARAMAKREKRLKDDFNYKYPKMTRPFIKNFNKSGKEFKRAFRPF